MTKNIAANGTWPSQITPQDVADKSPKLSEPIIYNEHIFWLQAQTSEKGRMCIMQKNTLSLDSKAEAILPSGFNVRSKVHEYGGGAYCVAKDQIAFVNSDDQQIYMFDYGSKNSATVYKLTNTELRFADLHFAPTHNMIFAVAEDHRATEIKNILVAIPLTHTQHGLAESSLHIVHEGHDFYAYPRISPNGEYLAFITWDHPNMPWDNSCLRLCSIRQNTLTPTITEITLREAQNESIFQPQWSPSNDLFFVSDRNNWWNIYSYSSQDIATQDINSLQANQHTHLDAEFATPLWNFNMSTYGFLNNDEILATYNQNSEWHLCIFNKNTPLTPTNKTTLTISCLPTSIAGICCHNTHAVFIGASPQTLSALYIYNDNSKNITTITDSIPPLNIDDIALAKTCVFSSDQTQVSAFFYPPANSQYCSNELAPMIVISHGGPTGQTENSFNYKIQYWTNRGFAVLDVNYRGSTGYGRTFRQLLQKQWGVFDVADLVNAAEYVTQHGWAAADKKIIKGSSAGGYSVLAALTFSNTFNAGVSLYGIGDLELLVSDTHKFEARYLDGLVGKYPEEKQRYQERSPINHIEHFSCPLLLFQGLEDKVVPPNQAHAIANALREKNMMVEHIEYPDEGHGFRNPINIAHMMTTEQKFYQKVFKLTEHDA